jgi:hypothetical protein
MVSVDELWLSSYVCKLLWLSVLPVIIVVLTNTSKPPCENREETFSQTGGVVNFHF